MTVEWHQGHYNSIAKDIRLEFPVSEPVRSLREYERESAQRTVLCDLALRLAARFKKYDPDFNVFKFLDQCSPDDERYPISELWDERGFFYELEEERD